MIICMKKEKEEKIEHTHKARRMEIAKQIA